MDTTSAPATTGLLASRDTRIRLGLFAAIFLICIGYARYTNHAWEDWYITFRASKNLAMGNGLTFTAGERVYSFTSPLGTTVPALCSLLAGTKNDGLALWFYRIFSAAFLGLAGVTLYSTLKRFRFAAVTIVGFFTALAFESKTIDHTINGMETGLMVFFLALAIRAHTARSSRPWLTLGMAWGGLMWTRPDGCVYGAAIAMGCLAFPPNNALGVDRRAMMSNYLRATGVAALIYLPWFAGTWIYYGSPVPHTIAAKSLESEQSLNPAGLLLDFLILPLKAYPAQLTAAEQVLTPSYARVFGGWPAALFVFSRMMTLLTAYAWLVPKVSGLTRALSLTTLLLTFYLTDVTPYAMPWYLPNLGMFVLLTFASTANDLWRWLEAGAREGDSRRLLLGTATLAPAFVMMCTFPWVALQSRMQQNLVEEGVRTQVGLYLRDHAGSPQDTVMLECLGYIGFFSGLKMYDYPGMGTPEMVAARRKLNPTHGPYIGWGHLNGDQILALLAELKPDWLVLRPERLQRIFDTDPGFLENTYGPAAKVSTREEILALPDIPGRGFLLCDATFYILRRIETKPPSAAEEP